MARSWRAANFGRPDRSRPAALSLESPAMSSNKDTFEAANAAFVAAFDKAGDGAKPLPPAKKVCCVTVLKPCHPAAALSLFKDCGDCLPEPMYHLPVSLSGLGAGLHGRALAP